MRYSYALTKKGQLTLPKEIRDALGIKPSLRVFLALDRKRKALEIKPAKDIIDLAGTIRTKKPFNPEALRRGFEQHYERR